MVKTTENFFSLSICSLHSLHIRVENWSTYLKYRVNAQRIQIRVLRQPWPSAFNPPLVAYLWGIWALCGQNFIKNGFVRSVLMNFAHRASLFFDKNWLILPIGQVFFSMQLIRCSTVNLSAVSTGWRKPLH